MGRSGRREWKPYIIELASPAPVAPKGFEGTVTTAKDDEMHYNADVDKDPRPSCRMPLEVSSRKRTVNTSGAKEITDGLVKLFMAIWNKLMVMQPRLQRIFRVFREKILKGIGLLTI